VHAQEVEMVGIEEWGDGLVEMAAAVVVGRGLAEGGIHLRRIVDHRHRIRNTRQERKEKVGGRDFGRV